MCVRYGCDAAQHPTMRATGSSDRPLPLLHRPLNRRPPAGPQAPCTQRSSPCPRPPPKTAVTKAGLVHLYDPERDTIRRSDPAFRGESVTATEDGDKGRAEMLQMLESEAARIAESTTLDGGRGAQLSAKRRIRCRPQAAWAHCAYRTMRRTAAVAGRATALDENVGAARTSGAVRAGTRRSRGAPEPGEASPAPPAAGVAADRTEVGRRALLSSAKRRGFISMTGIGQRHHGLQRPAWPPLETLSDAARGGVAWAPAQPATGRPLRRPAPPRRRAAPRPR